MSLRDSLKDAVARCMHLPVQHATFSQEHATADATGTQQVAVNPRHSLVSDATAYATFMQLASCTPHETTRSDARHKLHAEQKLHVARTTPCNTQLGGLTRHRLAGALAEAINRACDARGDDDRNRAGLLAECSQLTPEGQADMLAHFVIEAARWEAAGRGLAP